MRHQSLLVSVLATCAAFVAACNSGTIGEDNGNTGSLSLQLVLDNGAEINQVAWEITREGMEPMSGTIDTSAPGATASVEVFGLEGGDGYTITMTAVATDEQTSCKGEADFSVTVGEATDLMVVLRCQAPPRFGAVRVNGKFNICAELTKMIVSPLQTSVGSEIDLSASGEDNEGDEVAFRWTSMGGSIADDGAAETTFTCETEGEGAVTVEVSDDGFDHCLSGWTVPVTCVGDGGTGGAGGMGGGTGGAGGMPEPAQVRVAHLATDIPTNDNTAVDIFIDGELSPIQDLTFGNSTGFVPLPPGDYEFGIAPADDSPIFSFPATLSSGQIATVVAIRTVNNDSPENPVNVLVFDGSLEGLAAGSGRVLVGHGADNTAITTVDVISTAPDGCPPALVEDLVFGTVQGPLDLPADTYSVGIAVPDSCEAAVGPLMAPVTADVATLLIAVDENTEDGLENLAAAVYAIIGDADGAIPTLSGE